MAALFTVAQRRTLAAVCDTLIPALKPPPGATESEQLFWQRNASDIGVPEEFEKALVYIPEDRLRQLQLLLGILDIPGGAFLLTGRFRSFAELSFETRERMLQRWAVSRIGQLRQAFQSLKRLTQALFYSAIDEVGNNPNWPVVGYSGPLDTKAATEQPFEPLVLQQSDVLIYDAVVVGSGAGGGVVAAELARTGKRVLVVEKGAALGTADYTTRETEAFRDMYEMAGLLTTEDVGVTVLAGATLGGGTTINWTISFRTPEHVLEEWEREHGVTGIAGPEFQASLDAVCERISVNKDSSLQNPPNAALARGCAALGYQSRQIARNVSGCTASDCGWCCFGCVHAAKQGTYNTYLRDAVKAGADILVQCHVDKILIDNGAVYGVQGMVPGQNGIDHHVVVSAPIVVVAAGALHSPALLIRSGVPNTNIGRNLHLHPTTAARGEYDEPMEIWRGVMSSVYSDQFVNLDGRGYGAMIEVPAAHPGLLASALTWRSAWQFKAIMQRLALQASFIAITRDRDGGRVTIDKKGRPRLHYRLSRADGEHLLVGLQQALRLHVAAGAREVETVHSDLQPYRIAAGSTSDFEAYLEQVGRAGTGVNRLGVFSAHQMGTCRMGGRRNAAVVDPNCESWDVRNLFVTDAATFPTASGVNPMITIMAVAHRAAQFIKSRM